MFFLIIRPAAIVCQVAIVRQVASIHQVAIIRPASGIHYKLDISSIIFNTVTMAAIV